MLSEFWQLDQGSGGSLKHSFSLFSIFLKMGLLGTAYILFSNPGFFSTLILQEQYEFCYKVVQEYIDAFSDYANFK